MNSANAVAEIQFKYLNERALTARELCTSEYVTLFTSTWFSSAQRSFIQKIKLLDLCKKHLQSSYGLGKIQNLGGSELSAEKM